MCFDKGTKAIQQNKDTLFQEVVLEQPKVHREKRAFVERLGQKPECGGCKKEQGKDVCKTPRTKYCLEHKYHKDQKEL